MNEKNGLAHVLGTGFGFQKSKVLLSAIEFNLFTLLGEKNMTGGEIERQLNLHPRGTWDFIDALLALGFLEREGHGRTALYRNAEISKKYLDGRSDHYIGGMLKLADSRLYALWGNLSDSLRTGQSQNQKHTSGIDFFNTLYSNSKITKEFLDAMAGMTFQNSKILAKKFNFSNYSILCDVGGGTGQLAISIAIEHKNIKCFSFDLPVVTAFAKGTIESHNMQGRVNAIAGNFFRDTLPNADVIIMGMVLHNWNLEDKKFLIQAAYNALPENGVFIVIENLIDDERSDKTTSLLQSLNMLVELGDAFDFTESDLKKWCSSVGFKKFKTIHLSGPFTAVVSYKN